MSCCRCRILDCQTFADQPICHAFEMKITRCSGEVENFIDEYSSRRAGTDCQKTLDEPQSGEQMQMRQAPVAKPSDVIAQLSDPGLSPSRLDEPVTAGHSSGRGIKRNGCEPTARPWPFQVRRRGRHIPVCGPTQPHRAASADARPEQPVCGDPLGLALGCEPRCRLNARIPCARQVASLSGVVPGSTSC